MSRTLTPPLPCPLRHEAGAWIFKGLYRDQGKASVGWTWGNWPPGRSALEHSIASTYLRHLRVQLSTTSTVSVNAKRQKFLKTLRKPRRLPIIPLPCSADASFVRPQRVCVVFAGRLCREASPPNQPPANHHPGTISASQLVSAGCQALLGSIRPMISPHN